MVKNSKKVVTPEEILVITNKENLLPHLLKYQEMLGELTFVLNNRIKPLIPKISEYLITNTLHSLDTSELKLLIKKFNLNNNDIPNVLELKTDIKSFLFIARELISQQLKILRVSEDLVEQKTPIHQLSNDLTKFIIYLHSGKYSHLKNEIRDYLLHRTFELLYLRFVRNSVKSIGDHKAELIYTSDKTEIVISVKAIKDTHDKLLPYLTKEKVEEFDFKLIEIFSKTIDLFALFNNLIMDILIKEARKIDSSITLN